MLCVATTLLGIEVGWQRLPEGGMQYIIQLDPQTLDALRAGETIESDIPPAAGEIRSYRLIVGKKSLPRETPLLPPATPKLPEPKAADRPPPAPAPPHALTPDPGSRSLPERPAVYNAEPPKAAAAQPQPKPSAEPPAAMPAAPWLPLTFTLFGLFASLGANVFLCWVTWDARQRLRKTRGEERAFNG
jgi:hypothetical protein